MSRALFVGCERLATQDGLSEYLTQVDRNIGSVIYGHAAVDAYFNAIITLADLPPKLTIPKERIMLLKDLDRSSIKMKYNLLAAMLDRPLYDDDIEPFKSYSMVRHLRNEIIHHQAEWQTPGEIKKKFKSLFRQFNLKIEPHQPWQQTIFKSDKLAMWVYETIDEMGKNIKDNLLHYIEKHDA